MPSTKGEKYFVGDLQGCLDELKALLEQVDFNPKVDTLYLTGDLVARGPKSLETLRFVKSLGKAAKTVLGNHDLHLLATYFGIKKAKANDKLDDLLCAPELKELIDWLRVQPLLRVIKKRVVMSHAGISPQWNIKQAKQFAAEAEEIIQGENCYAFLSNMYQNTPERWDDSLTGFERFRYIVNCFSRMRFCKPDGSLELHTKSAPGGSESQQLVPWYQLKHDDWQNYTLVFGHWASLMGKTGDSQIIALDTGCVWGNYMSMWRLSDGKIFQCPAISLQQNKK